MERAVVLLDRLARRLAPLLGGPLDLLRQPLDLGELLPAGGFLAEPLAGAQERLVFVGLAQQPTELERLGIDHAASAAQASA